MKTHLKSAISVTVMGIALALVYSGPAVGQVVVTPPTVVVSPPAVIAPVPDYYVWDGTEYVGVVGDQYYYLGPGDVWIIMDPPRMQRFDAWQKGHSDWRTHATRNTRYRGSDQDRTQRTHSSPAPQTRSSGPPPATRSGGPAPKTHNSGPPPNSTKGSDHHDRDQNGSHNGPPQ